MTNMKQSNNSLRDEAYRKQLYDPKIKDIRAKMTLYDFLSHIYIMI